MDVLSEYMYRYFGKEAIILLDEYGMSDKKQETKDWYDGFTFGSHRDIYNPWSVLNLLDTGRFEPYWANTSSNGLVNSLMREGSPDVKQKLWDLLDGRNLEAYIDEQIVFSQLGKKKDAVWSLLLAGGYLKVANCDKSDTDIWKYELGITNREVRLMFRNMILDWFDNGDDSYNDFVKALLVGNLKEMNAYMNRVALSCFSYFDTGKSLYGAEPEKFYHGFVLGLVVGLKGRYVITSNRESGFGRYDVMLEPVKPEDDAIIMEFKVHDAEDEKDLKDTVAAALARIEDKQYASALVAKGFRQEKIRKYAFAFEGKKVLIGKEE